jgi:hypothetical protein
MQFAYVMFNLHGSELALVGLTLAILVVWVWSVIDCALNETDRRKKTLWLLFLLLAGYIVAPFYLIKHLIKNEK